MIASELIEKLELLDGHTPIGIFTGEKITDDLEFLCGEIEDTHVYFLASMEMVAQHAKDGINDGS